MKKLLNEFKDFIKRGNVLDMAVGVIVATSFGKITTSLINDVLMPIIGWICGTRDMTALNFQVRAVELAEDGISIAKEPITIGLGTFIGTIIDFILIALVVFFIVKSFNKAANLVKKKEEEAEEEEEKKPTTEELLTEILALMKGEKEENPEETAEEETENKSEQ